MKHGCLTIRNDSRTSLVLILVAIVFSLVCVSSQAGEIRIWPSAVVQSKDIRLGDIAELTGFAANGGHLSDTVVSASPCPGSNTSVSATDIRTAVAESGANLADIQIMGASHCAVTRQTTPKPPKQLVSKSAKPRYVPRPPRQPTVKEVKAPSSSTLETALREYIAARLGDTPGKIDVRFSPVNQRDLALPQGEYRFTIKTKDANKLGLVTFDVNILHSEEDERVVPILAEVALIREVVTAKRDINRGQSIESSDLALQERRFSDLSSCGIQDLNLVVGQRAREFIRTGDLVNEKLVEPKPIVFRGEPVTVWMRNGALVIKTAGRAQQAGGIGDKIEVRRDGSKRKQEIFEAIVTGPGTVTIGEPATLASR